MYLMYNYLYIYIYVYIFSSTAHTAKQTSAMIHVDEFSKRVDLSWFDTSIDILMDSHGVHVLYVIACTCM